MKDTKTVTLEINKNQERKKKIPKYFFVYINKIGKPLLTLTMKKTQITEVKNESITTCLSEVKKDYENTIEQFTCIPIS